MLPYYDLTQLYTTASYAGIWVAHRFLWWHRTNLNGAVQPFKYLANFAYVPVPGDCLGFLKVELPLTKDWLFFFHTFANTLIIDKPLCWLLAQNYTQIQLQYLHKKDLPTAGQSSLLSVGFVIRSSGHKERQKISQLSPLSLQYQ